MQRQSFMQFRSPIYQGNSQGSKEGLGSKARVKRVGKKGRLAS